MLGREEAKDVFDIICIAENYSFNWKDVFHHALHKQLMNEADILSRFTTFPATWLDAAPWLKSQVDIQEFTRKLEIISNDFLLAKDNSLGNGKTEITQALPGMLR